VKINNLQFEYSLSGDYIQLCLPIETETLVPVDDSVRLLDRFLEDLDYEKLYRSYSNIGRNPAISPKTLFKIIVYAYSQGIYSSRDIERACHLNLAFRWLLRSQKVPDHNTIARFRSERLRFCAEDLLTQIVNKLYDIGEVPFENLFIDGTKIEANANKYSFVWKKATNKLEAKLQEKARVFLEEKLQRALPLGHISAAFMREVLELWVQVARQKKIQFVYGSGNRKHQLQRDIETLQDFCERQEKYDSYNEIFEGRNSFSKTDHDATFMRLKDDHMRNGQLKPAYNLQVAVESEYIVGIDISNEASDMYTLKPLLERLKSNYLWSFDNVICDAGYESEENYNYLKQEGYKAYIKPSNYEYSKTRKFKREMEFRSRMEYVSEGDYFICPGNRKLTYRLTQNKKRRSGYVQKTKVYECKSCENCPHLGSCYRGKYNKKIYVSMKFDRYRQESLDNITSEHGIQLRINRSIQAEGVFGIVKWNYGFKRYLTRGEPNVRTETLLLAIAFNINKLHNRIQNGRCGQTLFEFQNTA
jgi:transposase